MTSTAPFGLYPSRSLVAGQRLQAGAVFALATPVVEAGATLFRHSLWLAVPAAAGRASALQLAASQLALRFEPAEFDVPTDDDEWFVDVATDGDNRTVRLELAWPATITAVPDPSARQRNVDFDLYRADGDRRADEPTLAGTTGRALPTPWVGSPMVVVMRQDVLPTLLAKAVSSFTRAPFAAGVDGAEAAMPAIRAAAGASAAAPASPAAAPAGVQGARDKAQAAVQRARALRREASHVVPALTLRGVPTSPRVRLSMEARGGGAETLLWQDLLPGEQGTATLPPPPLADAWAAALEQVRKRLGDEDPALDAPALLRLDIESDAPCRVTVAALALALDAEFEGLAREARVDFDGSQPQSHPLPLDLPAGALQGLVLAGRVDGGTAADAGAAPLPADLRRGLLLGSAGLARVHTILTEPARVAGLALAWHPLSDAVALSLRLLADAGDAPSVAPLAELGLRAPTPGPGWLALRLPLPLDLQARHLWLELAVDDGSGLWLADAAAAPPTQGYSESRDAPGGARVPLALQPAFAWLPAGPADAPAQPRRVALLSGSQVLAAQLDQRFEVDCPAGLLAGLASHGLQACSGSAARLMLVSARARLRLG